MPAAAAVRTGVVVAQAPLIVQAAVDAATLLRGHRPADLPVHVGYLLTSVALLPPLTARPGRGRPPTRSRSDAAAAALASLVTAVVVIRLHATWVPDA